MNPKASVLVCELSGGSSGILCADVSHVVAFLTLYFRGQLFFSCLARLRPVHSEFLQTYLARAATD